MASQKIFTTKFIDKLVGEIRSGNLDRYRENVFSLEEGSTTPTGIVIDEHPKLILQEEGNYSDNIENVKILFDAYSKISRTQATDVRFWAYLTHVEFWDYMKTRTRQERITADQKGSEYVLRHWFIQDGIERNDISRMWWGAKLTYDEKRKDPYELTEVLFSMLDFTRTVLKSHFGKHREFLHAFLEYIVEEKELFSSQKQDKARLLALKMNALGTYKNISLLEKEEVKEILRRYKEDLENVVPKNKLEEKSLIISE